MAWIVTAWKPEVLAAAERAGVVLPQPEQRRAPEPLAEPGQRFVRHELRDSPLADLFRPTT